MKTRPPLTAESTTVISATPGDFFEGFQRFWNQGGDDKNDDKNGGYQKDDELDDDDDDDDELPAGTTLLSSIPVKQLKPGGLRLFLMFFLMGMQNTPDKNSWRANQPVATPTSSAYSSSDIVPPSDNDGEELYVLEMFFHDASGMITIELVVGDEELSGRTSEIRILRCGSLPSNQYLMQESVIVDGILDELHQCAFDESVPEKDRLLIPEPKNGIDLAREALAFG